MSKQAAAAERTYFLSYSRSDERFALRLANDLRARGVAMWVDQLDIRPSEHWDRAIERAVAACSGLVVVLSPRSVASDNVADEISFAIDNGKSVLPVMIEKCALPLRITRMHVIDATSNYEKAVQQCVGELTRSHTDSSVGERESSPKGWSDPEMLAAAKRQLTPLLGPMAAKVVDQAASRASSPADLYGLLAQRIHDDRDRERFLAQAPVAPPSTPLAVPTENPEISANELNSLASALTPYLGPIAPIVAKRESRNCTSLADLRKRLAALIPSDRDRSAFLRRVTAAG
jgi:hypothetical protein